MSHNKQIRNICIIAHVDHGKTTLVDHLLRQAGTFQRDNQEICLMDSGDLEREKGITILAKNAAIQLDDIKINIIDTPGHADFGGEVERIMSMVDGAILLVDAAEGPLPQTRFVLEKAIQQGLRVILCINKVDRPELIGSSRIEEVVNQAFDLFVDLGANEEQADFPILYACGRDGWCTDDADKIPDLLADNSKGNLQAMFKLIKDVVPPPKISDKGGLQMLVANLAYSEFVGQLALGRIVSGQAKRNDRMLRYGITEAGEPRKQTFTAPRLYTFLGMSQVEVETLVAGDIGLISGCDDFQIGDTITSGENVPALPRISVEVPTLAMVFSVNTSPFSGQDGEAIQSRKLRDRLEKEVRTNVALRLEPTEVPDQYRVLGRGELQFAILIEQMRREGLEFMVGRPQVILIRDENDQLMEPMEEAIIDVPEAFAGDVTDLFQTRKGIMTGYSSLNEGGGGTQAARVRLEFSIPTRGLLGIRSRFMTLTRGEGILNTVLSGYGPSKGEFQHRINGCLISDRTGEAIEYALLQLEQRGTLLVEPGVKVYEGMIIGECARPDNLDVNPCKEKKMTNVRSVNKGAFESLKGVRKLSLEQCIEWIDDDEWIEVTPSNVRIRKKELSKGVRQSGRR